METINNLATAASKAVFGEQKEPVSGVQGDVSKGEPYDAGNLATPAQEKYQNDPLTGTSNLKSDNAVSQNTSTTTNPTSFHDLNTSGGSSTTTGRDTTLSGKDDSLSSRDNTISGRETTLPTRDASTTTHTTTTSSHTDTLGRKDNDTTSREDKVSGGNKDTTSGQNDTRDPEQVRNDPSTKQDLDTNTPGTSKPSDLKGPGPRPVEVVAKEHGGDAGLNTVGHSKGTSDSTSRTENQPANQSESNLKNKPTEHHETHSEEVVHASGFAADGGDFDATNPGAGVEADRLLDEKRQHGGAVGLPEKKSHTHGESHSGSHGPDDKVTEKEEKPSLGERIKAKLHRH